MEKKHVAQVRPETDFEDGSFRMRDQSPGCQLRMGKRKDGGKMEVQAVHFDPKAYDEKKARETMARLGLGIQKFKGCPAELAAEEPEAPDDYTGARIEARENGTFDLVGVEILAVGKFLASRGGEVSVTQEDLHSIANDTQANLSLLRPPAKLGHTENPFPTEKGAPALGWVKNVAVRGAKLLVDFTSVPASFVEALQKGRWRTRSAELMRWKHPETGKVYDRVLRAVSWLGAEMPAVQTLADVVALEVAAQEDPIDWIAVRASLSEQCQLTYTLTAAEHTDPGADSPEDELPGHETGEDDEPKDRSGSEDTGDAHRTTEPEAKENPMAKTTEEVQRDEALEAAAEAREGLIEATLELALGQRKLTPGDVEAETAYATEHLQTLSAVRAWADRIKARPQLADDTEALGTENLPNDEEELSTGRSKDSDPLADLPGDDWLRARANQICNDRQWDLSRYHEALGIASKENEEKLDEYYSSAYPNIGTHPGRA